MTLSLRLRALSPVAVLVLASACTHVPVYARATLANPTMTTSDLTRAAEEHVRAVQEGAIGGGFAAGGGCGCN
jgi:hypothetical protein